ncbi:MAG: glycosyltransferase [Chitinophagales bacterium]
MAEAPPILTVVIPAYNAEKYIRETIDSVLKQKTSFNFEVVVADDCSKDSTFAICQEYAQQHSNFKVIRHEKNLGNGQPNPNLYYVSTYPKTPFIAAIDADDIYATDDFLERQVQFLIDNPDVTKVFTNVEVFNSETGEAKVRFTNQTKPPATFDLHYYLKNTVAICQSSTVFRNSSENAIPSYVGKYFQCDWLLHVFHGLHGKLGYNDFVGVKYRVHSTNATNPRNQEKIFLDGIDITYNLIKKMLPEPYHKYFDHPRFEMNMLAFYYLRTKQFSLFLKWYIRWFKVTPLKAINFRDQFYLLRKNIAQIKK